MSASADRNLLFGILAVQLDFVTRDALIAAMNAWVLDKAKPLGDILRDQGHLTAERAATARRPGRRAPAAARQRPAAEPGGRCRRSEPTLRQQLAALPDGDVQALDRAGRRRQAEPPGPTTPTRT